jgi:glycosyltransferase involved in cell wall biosynthesis
VQNQAVALNGRFLAAPATGVQRVAEELIKQLDVLLDERGSCRRWTLFVPANAKRHLPLKNIAVRRGLGLGGPLWEQLELPALARGQLLVSLCNQAPLLHQGGVLMIHDAQAFISPQSYSPLFRLWYRSSVPRMAAAAARVLTVSHYSREKLIEYGIATPSKTQVVYNGIDHVSTIEADSGVIGKFGLSPRGYVVALSNTQKHKNISLLFEVFRQPAKSHLKLVLVGSAGKEDFARKGLQAPDNVLFCGNVSDAALRALYENALCLAFPSTTEGFGLPPLEAMQSGCPAIVAPRGALPEVCDDAALYADPENPGAWRDAINLLEQDPAARASLVDKGRHRASAFKWQESARQLMTIIKEVLAEPGRYCP